MKPRARQMPVNPPVPEVAELASATECTGLIPSAVRTPGQAFSVPTEQLEAVKTRVPAVADLFDRYADVMIAR